MTIQNDFGSLFVFSNNGKLLQTIDNVEFIKFTNNMLLDGKPLNCTASNMISKVYSNRELRDDQRNLVTAYLFDHPLVENVEGFYFKGDGSKYPAIIYIDPQDSTRVITLSTWGKAYENLTVIEF
jgi:hypothetical protein